MELQDVSLVDSDQYQFIMKLTFVAKYPFEPITVVKEK